MCQVLLRSKEVQGVVIVLKLNKGLLYASKPLNFNVSRSAAPNLALGPACQYNCDVSKS